MISLFVGVDEINKASNIVASPEVCGLFALLEAILHRGVIGFRIVHHAFGMRPFLGLGTFHIMVHPFGNLAVGHGIHHKPDKRFDREPRFPD
ncbi:MAG: hypothetical protein QOF48_1760, partial [Verrucomicrobiota bacterium]